LLQWHYNTTAVAGKMLAQSKDRQLDIQEFLRILPEISDQQPHVSRQSR
jgi:hypothetical protein